MGNYRFKLSDMVPNAWFYKLKDMGTKKGQNRAVQQHPKTDQKPLEAQQNSSFLPKNETLAPCRASYYFSSRAEAEKPHSSPLHPRASDTLFPQESPKKSKKTSRRKPIDSICSLKISPSLPELPILKLQLPPITTKPANRPTEKVEEAEEKKHRRRSPSGIHRLRMRATSPRIAASKKVQVGRKSVSKLDKKSMSQTFAVVKSSTDPQKDFRESMVEMIRENNIRSSNDLEELLACYLLLNENEYHDVIVKVFEQIWFDLTDIRL